MAFRKKNYVPTTFVKGSQYDSRAEVAVEEENNGYKQSVYSKWNKDPLSSLPGQDVEGQESRSVTQSQESRPITRTRSASVGENSSRLSKSTGSNQASNSKAGPKPKPQPHMDVRYTQTLADDDFYENSESRSRTSKKGRCVMLAKVKVCKTGDYCVWNSRNLTLYEHSLVLSKASVRTKLIRTSTGLSETNGPSVIKKRMGKEFDLDSLYQICYNKGSDLVGITWDRTSTHSWRQIRCKTKEIAAELVDYLQHYAPSAKLESNGI